VKNNLILPWQNEIWQSLWQRKQREQMPHALLFSGSQGIGKRQFAKLFAHALLCSTPASSGEVCGQCKSCRLTQADTHPDLLWIEPEEAGQMIKIDQIRALVHSANETALMSGYRVIIINPANAMNMASANALLKTLEEPTDKTVIILISAQSTRLPATITSRCQRINFPKPATDVALAWLEQSVPAQDAALLLTIAENAPLKAQTFLAEGMLELRQNLYQGLCQLSESAANPLKLAADWAEKSSLLTLDLLMIWVRDLLRAITGIDNLVNYDYHAALVNLTQKIAPPQLLEYISFLQKMYQLVLSSVNMNRQLLLEELFIRWQKLLCT